RAAPAPSSEGSEDVGDMWMTDEGVEDDRSGEIVPHPAYVDEGIGHAPSAEGRAEAMKLFEEVNGPPTAGHAPSAEGSAEAMKMFEEVNGPPTAGHAPSAENRAEVMEMFEEVNGPPAGRPPSKKNQDDAMDMFRDVNDDVKERARAAAMEAE